MGDVNQYIWFENQTRDCLCLLNIRYKKTNNELVEYKPHQRKNYILPLDVINLYRCILCLTLPSCNFSWLNREETETFNILNTRADSEVGYIIEAVINYPDSSMDSHNNFPLAPEHLILTDDYLTPLCERFV